MCVFCYKKTNKQITIIIIIIIIRSIVIDSFTVKAPAKMADSDC